MSETDDYMTAEEAAAILNISISTFHNWYKSAKLAGVEIKELRTPNKTYRIKRRDLQTWIEAHPDEVARARERHERVLARHR